MGGVELIDEQLSTDQALASIYNQTNSGGLGDGVGKKVPGGRGAGNDPSAPVLSKWLGDVRILSDKELVTIIQFDAMERCGLKQPLFEPELLESLEPDMNLTSMILALKDQIPGRSRDQVRVLISRIVEEINRLLADDIRRAVTAAVGRRRHSLIPSTTALDYKDIIRRDLKNYSPELKGLAPERFYFYDRITSNVANKYTAILDADQSDSMGESVIYSLAISCILASIVSVKARIVVFDTEITDLTEQCEDPMDLLLGLQLGGGMDIEKPVAYCQQSMENPGRTLFFLVSDPMEGGNRAGLLRRIREMKEFGAIVVCLLAIAGGGKPYYDGQIAGRVASMDVPRFACSSQRMPELLERALKGQDLNVFQKELLRSLNAS